MSEKTTSTTKSTTKARTITVKVSPKLAKGAAFFDTEQRVTIGEKPVSVELTQFVSEKLYSTGELVEA